MKLVILNGKDRYLPEDVTRLESAGAVFYQTKGNKLEDVKELYDNTDGVVLGVQPGYIDGVWDGLSWEKLSQIKNLRGICLSTTAYGWVPFEKLAEENIPVTNVPGKSTNAVAEYYIFIMTALLRRLPLAMRQGWQFPDGKNPLGVDACGLTAGIIGLGSIGTKIADLCNGYQMNVIYWNRSPKTSPYKSQTLEEVCQQADVIFICTTSDSNTKGLVDSAKIDLMKKTAIILSPVDAHVYDKQHAVDKIIAGNLGGLGFESDEEKLSDYKGNIFPAPEIGYYTKQTMDKESRIMTDSLLSILNGQPVNVVNIIK